jgi:hypothetical protein
VHGAVTPCFDAPAGVIRVDAVEIAEILSSIDASLSDEPAEAA